MNDRLDSILRRNNDNDKDDDNITKYLPHLAIMSVVGMSLLMMFDTKPGNGGGGDRIRYIDIDTKKEVDPSLLHQYEVVDLTSTIDKPSDIPK